MKLFGWSLLVVGIGSIALAAIGQNCGLYFLSVLFGGLAGAAFSALMSLVVGRMMVVQQTITETLSEVKNTNPLTPSLGQKTQIRMEILTDIGIRAEQSVIIELQKVIAACRAGEEHGQGADPLYKELKKAAFAATIQSIFCPKFFH